MYLPNASTLNAALADRDAIFFSSVSYALKVGITYTYIGG